MNPEDAMRYAAGETDSLPPAPPQNKTTSEEAVQKDTAYSPASETETEQKQDDPLPDGVDADIDPDDIRAVPGTGGPDDTGDVDVDEADLNLPFRDGNS